MSRRDFLLHSTQALAVGTMPAWMRHSHAAETEGVGRVVTLGCSMALSGPLGAAGLEQVAGMKAAFHEINRSGGIHGREIALQVMDDAYVPARTLKNVTELVDAQSVFALISPMGTANTAALLPLIEGKGIPTVGPITGAPSVRSPEQRNLFFVRPSYADEARRLVQQMVDMGLRRIAVVYLDNGYGRELQGVAAAELQRLEATPAAELALEVKGDNANAVLQALKQARPSAVLLLTAGTSSLGMIQGIKQQLPGVLMAGLSSTIQGLKLDDAASGMAVTTIVPDPNRGKNGVVRNYQAAMQAQGEQEFSQGSLEAYINAHVLAYGLRLAGKEPTPARVRAALSSIRNFDLGGFVVSYGATPPFIGSRFIELGIIGRNGRFVG